MVKTKIILLASLFAAAAAFGIVLDVIRKDYVRLGLGIATAGIACVGFRDLWRRAAD